MYNDIMDMYRRYSQKIPRERVLYEMQKIELFQENAAQKNKADIFTAGGNACFAGIAGISCGVGDHTAVNVRMICLCCIKNGLSRGKKSFISYIPQN